MFGIDLKDKVNSEAIRKKTIVCDVLPKIAIL